MEEEKIGPNDGSNCYQRGGKENDDSEQASQKKQEEYEEFAKGREVLEKERDEERQKEISQLVEKGGEEREKKTMTKEEKEGKAVRERVKPQKDFLSELKKKGGVFRKGKLYNYQSKKTIDKTLNKVRGLSKKQRELYKGLLGKYHGQVSKTVLQSDRYKKFAKAFKSKRYDDPRFSKIRKEGKNTGYDIKEIRGAFSKRELDKIEKTLLGTPNPKANITKIRTNSNKPRASARLVS